MRAGSGKQLKSYFHFSLLKLSQHKLPKEKKIALVSLVILVLIYKRTEIKTDGTEGKKITQTLFLLN